MRGHKHAGVLGLIVLNAARPSQAGLSARRRHSAATGANPHGARGGASCPKVRRAPRVLPAAGPPYLRPGSLAGCSKQLF